MKKNNKKHISKKLKKNKIKYSTINNIVREINELPNDIRRLILSYCLGFLTFIHWHDHVNKIGYDLLLLYATNKQIVHKSIIFTDWKLTDKAGIKFIECKKNIEYLTCKQVDFSLVNEITKEQMLEHFKNKEFQKNTKISIRRDFKNCFYKNIKN